MSSKNKNKNKVKKLSDADYARYIMALKDETPPSLVKENQQDWTIKKRLKIVRCSSNGFFCFKLLLF